MITDSSLLPQDYDCRELVKALLSPKNDVKTIVINDLPHWMNRCEVLWGNKDSFESCKSKYKSASNTIDAVLCLKKDANIGTIVHELQHAKDFWSKKGKLHSLYIDYLGPTMKDDEYPPTKLVKCRDLYKIYNNYSKLPIEDSIYAIFANSNYWLEPLEESAIIAATVISKNYDESLLSKTNGISDPEFKEVFKEINRPVYNRIFAISIVDWIIKNIDRIDCPKVVDFIAIYDVDKILFPQENYKYDKEGIQQRLEKIKERLLSFVEKVYFHTRQPLYLKY